MSAVAEQDGATPKFKGFLPRRAGHDARWTTDWTVPQINLEAFRELDDDRARHVVERIKGFVEWRARNAVFQMYPETGPVRRDLYLRHMRFFESGAEYRERCFLAANRVGKTEGAGGYETAMHLTGLYPPWWRGRRFDRPVRWWVAGKTNESTRDIVQRKLFGPVSGSGSNKTVAGTGLIPANCIAGRPTWKAGVADLIDTVPVRHVSGGLSLLGVKSYQQGRGAFEGTEQDGIWLDEEPPVDVYDECLIRTATTHGLIMLTFTPLEGMSDVVTAFLPPTFMHDEGGEDGDGGYRVSESKYLVQAGWDHVPHLDEKTKRELYAATIPYLREARSKGIPSLGSGAIYPVPEAEIAVDPFVIPPHWPRAYAMDVGWRTTAALWGAIDPETGVIYFYSEHYRHQAEPAVHAEAVRARGEWIEGAIDPASRGRSQIDGEALLQLYEDLGLILTPADNAVESGLYETWELLSGGRIKVFRNLSEFFGEYRVYQRDEKGRIVKRRDHLMDCLRYFVTTGRRIARIMAPKHATGGGPRFSNWRTV